jgi:hypothetical protein
MADNHNELSMLLSMIDHSYRKQAWHGPNLRGSLRGVTAGQASWRPAPARHCIWEIALHAAYWKYAVRRRLRGETKGSFPLKGSNWFRVPASLDDKGWKVDLAILEQEHLQLRKAIEELPPDQLFKLSPGSKHKNVTLIWGIASHDIYHAGQIQLLKRLQRR